MDVDSLPLDTSHPAVREHLSLVRLQVLTPLSLLINIATVLACATVTSSTLGEVAKLHPTSISPNNTLIAIYIVAIWVGQIGYCTLLVLASKPETKRTVVKAVGLALVFANWLMSFWATAWAFQFFFIATLLQGCLLACLLYSNIALLIYHPPVSSRPLDTGLIHAPMRLFLILPLSILFPYSLFLALRMDNDSHAWSGFAVVFCTNLIATAVILSRRDIVWCVAATWICVSVWTKKPKQAPVYITEILFTVLHPITLFAAYVYSSLYSNGRIALPPDEEVQHASGHGRPSGRETEPNGDNQRPREIDSDEVWS